jgi:hypothetical protein
MRWTASQHSGTSNNSTASFSFGTVKLDALGIPLTLPQGLPVTTVLEQINSALLPAGVSLTLPAQSTDPGTGAISMGPLRLRFSGSTVENALLGPTSNGLASLEKLIAGQAGRGTSCSDIRNLIGQLANPTDSIVNVLVGAAEGAGGVDLDLGGASAGVVTAPNYVNPFGSGGGLGRLPPPPPTARSTTSTTPAPVGNPATVNPASTPGSAATPTNRVAPTPPAVSPAGANPVLIQPGRSQAAPAKASLIRCVTTSPVGHPGCWKGLGSAAAGAVVALGAGLLAADIWQSRRPRRRRTTRRVTA